MSWLIALLRQLARLSDVSEVGGKSEVPYARLKRR